MFEYDGNSHGNQTTFDFGMFDLVRNIEANSEKRASLAVGVQIGLDVLRLLQ